MIPNDIGNTLFEALALMWSNSSKAEQVNIDAALAWLEAQEKEQIQASYSQESVKTFNNEKEQGE